MDAISFAYWLQGRMEMLPNQLPSETEWKMIRDHLATVFNKVTPTYPTPTYPHSPLNPYKPLVGDIPMVVC